MGIGAAGVEGEGSAVGVGGGVIGGDGARLRPPAERAGGGHGVDEVGPGVCDIARLGALEAGEEDVIDDGE